MKIKNHIIYETAKDVVDAIKGSAELNLTVPPDGTYLVFENDMSYCHISGYSSNYDGDIFEISSKVDPEDIIKEMADQLGFMIHIT